ncbi:unnamed protein product [Ranitomeya imitator]|uniref:Branchpoint-bridging protein n=1 Tax=Ranitomeya imitator TaxID=111125 RepID=A0ABN9LKE1_9NEOB|nr:unnamed protein product [Ranitomeya imitator]
MNFNPILQPADYISVIKMHFGTNLPAGRFGGRTAHAPAILEDGGAQGEDGRDPGWIAQTTSPPTKKNGFMRTDLCLYCPCGFPLVGSGVYIYSIIECCVQALKGGGRILYLSNLRKMGGHHRSPILQFAQHSVRSAISLTSLQAYRAAGDPEVLPAGPGCSPAAILDPGTAGRRRWVHDFCRKRKRSRWNDETPDQKTIIPGMPTVIPPGLSREQERAYIVQLQIEDLTRKLRTGDLGIPPNPEDRSPSPEPIYNSEGKRLNTREFRTRKKLEEERHNLITEMVGLNPDFKPPADYKPPATRVSDKVMIPQDEYPEINFVGLLIGPRGNTLKNIEKECNAKIMIRGKGSVKEGKVGRKDGQMLPGEEDDRYTPW